MSGGKNMNINDYFVVFYKNNRPIDSFYFNNFSEFYICPQIKNGHYIRFNVYSNSHFILSDDIPNYDYHVYWPVSLFRLYNRLVYQHKIKSPYLRSFCYNRFDCKHYHYYQRSLKFFHTEENDFDCHIKYMDKFRNRFKSVIVMK